MSYRIRYPSFEKEKMYLKGKHRRAGVVAGILTLILFFGAMSVKHKGLRWVQTYLLPGDPAVTAAALEDLAADLKEGENLKDAISDFCREIMAHGQQEN